TGNALQSFIPPAGIFDGIAPGQTTLLQQFGYAQRASVAVCVVEFERRLYQFGYSTQAKSRLRPPPGQALRPARVLHLLLPYRFGVAPLHVQSICSAGGSVVDFDPTTTRMTAGARGHPDHVLSGLLPGGCLPRCRGFQIKVELSALTRFRVRVHDG